MFSQNAIDYFRKLQLVLGLFKVLKATASN